MRGFGHNSRNAQKTLKNEGKWPPKIWGRGKCVIMLILVGFWGHFGRSDYPKTGNTNVESASYRPILC